MGTASEATDRSTPRHPVVCMPARGRADDLRATLSALARTHPALPVIVALDGPDPALRTVAEQSGSSVVELPVPAGSYAARNAAVDALPPEADAVLFTDAGCEPLAGWADAHLASLTEVDLSVGAVQWRTSGELSPAEWVDVNRHLRQDTYAADGYGATCNLAVRRAVLDRVRFDSGRRSGGDRLFGRQAGALGHRLAYAPDAVVVHDARRTGRQIVRKAFRVGVGVGSLPPVAAYAGWPRVRLSRDLLRRAAAVDITRGRRWRFAVVVVDFSRLVAFRAGAFVGQRRSARPG